MQIVKKPEEGTNFVEYSATKKSITFGDDEIMINLEKKERDDAVHIDITRDYTGGLLFSTGDSAKDYVAQIDIPAREYTEKTEKNPDYDPEAEDPSKRQEYITTRTPVAFSMDNVVLTLYEMEV